MADKNDYYEFIYAYSFGCLDENDLVSLKEYLKSNDDYYWQELGEFQNLSSLLPSILSIESPDPEVKDRVARKLYRIRNEIKAKRDKRKDQKIVTEDNDEEKIDADKIIEPVNQKIVEEEQEEIVTEKSDQNVEDFEVVSSALKDSDINIEENDQKEETTKEVDQSNDKAVLNFNTEPEVVSDNEIETTFEEDEAADIKAQKQNRPGIAFEERVLPRQDFYRQNEGKAKKKFSLPVVITFLVMLIPVVVFVFMYYKASSNVNKYESQIVSLNEQILGLKEQFRQNQDLRAVLSSKNLKTLNLVGSDLTNNAFGKLFISLDTNHGILQFFNLNTLQGNETYQLWIYIYDNYMSLGKFNPTGKSGYFSFDTPQLSESSNVNFLVTEEAANGPLQPGDKVYLTGSF